MMQAKNNVNMAAFAYKLQKNSFVSLCSVAITCGIALDVNTRFSQNERDTHQGNGLVIQEAYLVSKLELAQAQAINQQLISLGGPVEESQPEVATGLTEQDKKMLDPEQQKAQQGELVELYIGNNRYELVGIFRQASPFAVFHQSTINEGATAITDQSTSYKWAQSQAIEHFKLSEIHQGSITILNGDHTITMRIFSPL